MTHKHDSSKPDFSFIEESIDTRSQGIYSINKYVSDAEYEKFWKNYTEARNAAALACHSKLAEIISQHYPEAQTIILYEDRSHDAPHGHLEGILDVNGSLIISGTSDEWHELDWSADADDLIWDTYHLGSHLFNTLDGKRRLVIRIDI